MADDLGYGELGCQGNLEFPRRTLIRLPRTGFGLLMVM